jgi:hypothetical protein
MRRSCALFALVCGFPTDFPRLGATSKATGNLRDELIDRYLES